MLNESETWLDITTWVTGHEIEIEWMVSCGFRFGKFIFFLISHSEIYRRICRQIFPVIFSRVYVKGGAPKKKTMPAK